MTLLQRATRLAVIMLTSAGLLGTSTPGLASDTVVGTTPPVLGTTLNPPATPLVPPPAATTSTKTPVVEPARKASFASLDDAVAAQDGAIENEHVRCLATAIYYESKSEPLIGQLAVAHVIMNRIRSGRFASSVCGVVKQRGQFSFVRGGALPVLDNAQPSFRRAVGVAKLAMADGWKAPAGDALYFNNARAGHSGTVRVAVIGNHAFYR